MAAYTTQLEVDTRGRGFNDISAAVQAAVGQSGVDVGLCQLFIRVGIDPAHVSLTNLDNEASVNQSPTAVDDVLATDEDTPLTFSGTGGNPVLIYDDAGENAIEVTLEGEKPLYLHLQASDGAGRRKKSRQN